MKNKFFTRLITLGLLAFGVGQFTASAQSLNTGTGTGWGTLPIGTSLLLSEDFSGYDFFHSDDNTDQGNSDNVLDGTTGEIVYGYIDSMVTTQNYIGYSVGAKFTFKQCAFAPEWKTAWAYRDSTDNTTNVSNGFVEISRDYPYTIPTVRGYMMVDLTNIQFVEAIQYSHSSTGGNKRGVMVEFSLDNGASWDTLRYQPGNAWSDSFTKDVNSGVKTPNGYRCDPSAYGMTWEDGIYAANVTLRFSEAGGQTPRIHDLKVYGFNVVAGVEDNVVSDITVSYADDVVTVSEDADVAIYSVQGVLIQSYKGVSEISISELPAGMYIINASAEGKSCVTKILHQ